MGINSKRTIPVPYTNGNRDVLYNSDYIKGVL